MSAESEYHCSQCGHEWEAVPPSSCPRCAQQPDAGCRMPDGMEPDEVDAAHAAWAEKLKALVTEHYGERCGEDEAGCPTCVVWRAVDRLIDPLELSMESDRTQAGRLQARVAELEKESADALLLVAQVREAVGDNGRRMQDELMEFLRGLRADKDLLDSGMIVIPNVLFKKVNLRESIQRAIKAEQSGIRHPGSDH